jgi:hypothetical protein
MRRMETLARGLPGLPEKYQWNFQFGMAGVSDFLPANAQFLEASWLESTLFLNRGDHFAAAALPAEAQFSAAMGVASADFNGDGNQDIFLAQNYFALPPDYSRLDAGQGLLLEGDGKGGFHALDAQRSGVDVPGEMRAAAVADYDGDGRIDLAVTQNGSQTKLFHNLRAKAGLRIRLDAPGQNRSGIGAALRLAGQNGPFGPVQEIQAGSGFLSQNSAIQILAASDKATAVWVRWPDGSEETIQLPAPAKEIVLTPGKPAKVIR